MPDYICDDVEYIYNDRTQMLYIWLSNDDRYYEQPKRSAKYDFGRNPDKEEKKVKLLKGIYREPYLDGWKYTINGKVCRVLVNTILDYANYGRYIDEDGNRIAFTYLRHNRKALGIHYLIERYVGSQKKDVWWDFYDYRLVPYFPTPQNYNGINPQPYKDTARISYRGWTHNTK